MKVFSTIIHAIIVTCLYSSVVIADFYVIPVKSAGVTTVFFSGFNSTGAYATQIRYAGIAGASAGSSEDGHIFPIARDATISNFTLYVTGRTLTGAETMTITLRKNGGATSITKTFNSSSAENQVYSVPNTVTYSGGDRFSIPVVASTNAAGQVHVSGSFDIKY